MRTVLIIGTILTCSLATFAHASYLPVPGYNSGGTTDGIEGGGGMCMLNVSFTAVKDGNGIVTGGTLSMVPQGKTIYLARRPAGSFDPAAVWGVLDGTGYSRRLGWNPGTGLADIPAGDSIWIQRVTASPGLKCYYAQNANPAASANPITKAYTYYSGMFGTAGSDTKWQWDQMMDHNAYALDMADAQWVAGQTLNATYKLYIGDAGGNEILNAQQEPMFQSATEVWTWTVPEPTTLCLLTTGLATFARRKKSTHD